MAFKKRRGGGNRPQFSVSTSVAVRKGKYVKGPSFGLWTADSGPMARGSVKDDYLEELISFLKKAHGRDQSVSFALFKNGKKVRTDDDDDDDDDDEDEEDEDEEEHGLDKDDDDEDEDEEDEKPTKKKAKKSTKKAVKEKGKKSDWNFDDDDE